MFLKRHVRRKNGKDHTYWSLVKSERMGKWSRHRTLAYLGELDVVDCGDVWLGLTLWRTLELDKLFAQIMPKGREKVGWDLMATILVLGRFCDPSSELHIEDTWYPRTVLPEMLGVKARQVHVRRLYQALDVLCGCKQAVEKHLENQLGRLFNIDYDLLLYDVTSTYFEGEAARNPQAKRGYSRDKRSDCKQVCIALVVTTDGLPLAFEVFDGNRNDATTVEEIVRAMEKKYGKARRLWVLDRGMVNEDNLAFIRERDGKYIVGTPRSMLRKYEQELTESGWTSVYEDLEVKLCASPDGDETFVVCRSAQRAEKEKAMHQRFSKRIEQSLVTLAKRLSARKKRPDRGAVERQIGRLLQKNSRAAGKYDIRVTDDLHRKGHLELTWRCREEWSHWATLSEGAYLLRTNLTDRTPQDLWKAYMQLTDAEAAFRTIKSELCLRPVYHQLEHRVHAHILVAFLAYAMWKTLQKWMENSGLGRGVRTVQEELARIKCSQVILPTSSGREVQLRCITRPDEGQRILLNRLGLRIPFRLGSPKWRRMIET